MLSNNLKINVRIEIAAKGRGNVGSFTGFYSMQEHYDEKWRKDGYDYAKNELKLNANEVAISDWPIISPLLESKIEEKWGSGDKVVPGHMVFPKIHNPMHSCFKGYRVFTIDDVTILVKPVSDGVAIAVANDAWSEELKVA